MNRHLPAGLLALYPRAFRDRYGAELARLTDELISAGEITPLLAVLNLAGGAALEWGRVLTGSRRAALAVAAAAVIAAAGSLIGAAAGISYLTGQARPPLTPASARSVSAPAAIAQPAAGCAAVLNPAGPGADLVPTAVLVPGTLSTRAGPQLNAAGPCVAMLDSGLAASRHLTVGSVLTIDGVKFTVIGIVTQPQASNPRGISIPLPPDSLNQSRGHVPPGRSQHGSPWWW
jgi:hypothetical protein